MANKNETIPDVVRELRACPADGLVGLLFKLAADALADRIEAAWKFEAQAMERIIRDAIIGYVEDYSLAPNDDVERELKERATVANEWLKQHGFAEEPTNWSKEETSWL